MILKYSKALYQKKINTFDSLNNQLKTHEAKLEELRNQIPQFMEGKEAGDLYELISKKILKVNMASDNIARLKTSYQEIIDDHSRTEGYVEDLFGGAKQVIGAIIKPGK